jgi:hypothetical protein
METAMSKRSERAADKFLLNHLGVNAESALYMGEKDERDVVRLVRAAFLLYELDGTPNRGWNICRWVWPYDGWAPDGLGNPDFKSNEPWTVLFRQAYQLYAARKGCPTAVAISK